MYRILVLTNVKNYIINIELGSKLEYNSRMINMNEKVDEFKKKLILDTAHEYFSQYGYEKTQIEKIAKELSVGVGTIYGYFRSKEGLFMAWFEHIVNNAFSEIKEHCEASSSPEEKLQMLIDYKIKYFEKNKTTIREYIDNKQAGLRGVSKRNANPMAKVYEYSANIIKEIKPTDETDAYILAKIFDGMINSYIECYKDIQELKEKSNEIMKRFMRILEE